VAVGDFGTIISSSDATTWIKQNSSQFNNLQKVVFANGTFVAIGYGGTIVTSNDGVKWTIRISGVTNDLLGIAWGANTFVVSGKGGLILTSPDGITWNRQNSSGERGGILCVLWTGSKFVGFSDYYYHAYWDVLESSDGVNWAIYMSDTKITNAAFGLKKYIGWTAGQSNLYTSSDGLGWTNLGSSNDYFEDIIWADSQFIAIATDSSDPGAILKSADGVSWLKIGSAILTFNFYNMNTGSNHILHAGNQYVVSGQTGSISTSPDGISWTKRNRGTVNNLKCVVWDGNQFVTAGDSGTTITSHDGTSWAETVVNGGNIDFRSLAYGNGRYAAICNIPTAITIMSSSDGIDWQTSLTNAFWANNIVYENGQFVAVGDSGKIFTSMNGSTWTRQASGTYYSLHASAWGNGLFVVGGEGVVVTSSDGFTWTSQPFNGRIFSMAWGNNMFLAEGDKITNEVIWTSTNGVSWNDSTLPANFHRSTNIVWDGHHFILVAYTTATDSGISITVDGNNISSYSTGVNMLNNVAFGNNTFVAVGDNGTIVTSLLVLSVIQPPSLRNLSGDLSVQEGKFARYSLSGCTAVSMRLYDIRGRLVAVLVDEKQGPGMYTMRFPSHLSSGTYILSLKEEGRKLERLVTVSK